MKKSLSSLLCLLLVCALGHKLQDYPLARLNEVKSTLLAGYKDKYPGLVDRVKTGAKLTKEQTQEILAACDEILKGVI